MKLEKGMSFEVVEVLSDIYSFDVYKKKGFTIGKNNRYLINGSSGLFHRKNQMLFIENEGVKPIGRLIIKEVKNA